MPPRRYSRYTFSQAYADANGRLLLTDPDPFPFVALADNVVHTVNTGDTVFGIADVYFRPLARPSGFWWVICDYQPTPIYDPTVALVPGSVIYVPSVRTVLEQIFNANRSG